MLVLGYLYKLFHILKIQIEEEAQIDQRDFLLR